PQVRFEKVFFSVRPIVLSLALATMFSSTTLSSSRLNVHRARPFGGSEQARAINLASEAPSKMRVLAEAGECLRVSTASNPSSTSCWRVRAIVARLVFKALAIWLSLQASPASPASAFNRMRAFVNLWAGCLPLRIRLSSRSRSSALSFTTYFFTAISSAATNRLRHYVAEPSIRPFYSLSMTGGTSGTSAHQKRCEGSVAVDVPGRPSLCRVRHYQNRSVSRRVDELSVPRIRTAVSHHVWLMRLEARAPNSFQNDG